MSNITSDDFACDTVFGEPEGYPYDTRMNLNYTYSLDKLSCVREAYFVHVTFAYLVVFSGIACFVSRLDRRTYQWHAVCGRLYIVCMLWCMATSLLVHNSGLPVAVLICFLFVLVGLTAGWFCIKLHQGWMQGQVVAAVQIKIGTSGTAINLKSEMDNARHTISKNLTWQKRIFSWKAAHGMLMFLSWINVAGRLFGSDQSGDFTCHTYPVYKQLDSRHFYGLGRPLSYVPIMDPEYDRLPWAKSLVAWGVLLSVVPLMGAAVIGLVYSFISVYGWPGWEWRGSDVGQTPAGAVTPSGEFPMPSITRPKRRATDF